MEQTEIGAEEKMSLLPTQNKQPSNPTKGGLRTMPFIIVNESLEKVASYGLVPNMILYLMEKYHMETARGSSILFLWSAISNSMSIFGAFLSDSYLGRFRVIALGSFSSLLGMTLLWLTAMIPQLKPPPCDQINQECNSATPAQFAFLFSSFGLISIGAGCIRPCSIAFGADQLKIKENPNNERVLDSFFNWYYASIALSGVLAVTIIVYVQDHFGWEVGFAVPVILMVISALLFLVGSSLYVKVKASKSLFTRLIQVLVAAFKNRDLTIPQSNFDQYYDSHDSKLVAPTENLRCLNKACIIRNTERDLNPDGTASNPWSLCTVEQVESLKSVIRVIPLWSTGIMMVVTLNQTSFGTLQAKTMDRHITQNFEIPAGSFSAFSIIALTIWIAFYDRVMVPLLAKYSGQPRGLSPKVRMGIGLLLSCVVMAMSTITENIRRRIATEEWLEDEPDAVIGMSALWLMPQYALLGIAEAFNSVGQIEFYYSHIPKSLSSIALAIFTLGLAIASLVGSLLIDIVNGVTSKGGKESWLASNLNKGHLDYYYGLITFLDIINFMYFLVCCWTCGSSDLQDWKTRVLAGTEEEQLEFRDLPSS